MCGGPGQDHVKAGSGNDRGSVRKRCPANRETISSWVVELISSLVDRVTT